MPQLTAPTNRTRVPYTIAPFSAGKATDLATQILVSLSQDAPTDGNSVEDWLAHIRNLARTEGRFRGNWANLAGQTLYPGDVVTHFGGYYLVISQHTRGGSGPDSDSTHYRLLNNWRGAWSANYYHEGSLVLDADRIWLALRDTLDTDPAPHLDTAGKWKATSQQASSVVTVEHDSPTISHADSQSRLQSPGPEGVWAGPSVYPRGAEFGAQVLFAPRRPSGAPNNLTVDNLPATISQFFSEDGAHVVLGENVPEHISMEVTVQFDDEPAGAVSAIQVAVALRHSGSSTLTQLHLIEPTVPGGTSSGNPYIIQETIDLSGVEFKAYDWIIVTYTATGGSDAQKLDPLDQVILEINVDGLAPVATDYDSYPVQSRPIRDLRSVDTSDPTKEQYNASDLTLTNGTDRIEAMITNADGETTGSGWTITNTGHRGLQSNTTDVVATAAVTLGFHYSAYFTFSDRESDPGHPDQFRVDLVRQLAAHTDGEWGNFDSFAHGFAADLIAYSGPIVANVINDQTHVVTDWAPQTTGDEAIADKVTGYIPGAMSGTARGIKLDVDGCRRLRLTISGSVIADPGDVVITLTSIDTSGHSTHIVNNRPWVQSLRIHVYWSSSSPTQGDPATFTHEVYDSDADALSGVSHIHGLWAVTIRSNNNNAIDLSVVNNLQLNVQWWGDDDDTRTLDVRGQVTMAIGDKVAVQGRNATTTTQTRSILPTKQELYVWNVNDSAGRTVSATGGLASNRQVSFSAESTGNTQWWVLDANIHALTARRDHRRMAWTLSVPGRNTSLNVEVWRQHSSLATRERLALLQLKSSSAATTHTGTALAIVAGESILVTASKVISGTFTLGIEAETIGDIPAIQTQTAGLLRPKQIASGELPGGVSGGFSVWVRAPLIPGFHWGQGGVTHWIIESSNAGKWDPFIIHLDLLSKVEALDTTRLGERVNTAGGGDDYIEYNLDNRSVDLFVAPLKDGGIALARGDGTARAIEAFVE